MSKDFRTSNLLEAYIEYEPRIPVRIVASYGAQEEHVHHVPLQQLHLITVLDPIERCQLFGIANETMNEKVDNMAVVIVDHVHVHEARIRIVDGTAEHLIQLFDQAQFGLGQLVGGKVGYVAVLQWLTTGRTRGGDGGELT